MGKIIVRKVKGMSLKVKISLVLVFTMLFSTFIYQGWYAPKSAMAAAARVGTAATGNTGSTAAASFNVTLGATPTNGNTLIAVISTRSTSANAVTDITQTGATWSRVASTTGTAGTTTEIWYAPGVSGAGTTVTIGQASVRSAAVIVEYSGLLSANSIDKTATSTGSGTAAVTGTTATTTQAAELWIGGIGFTDSSRTLGTYLNSFVSAGNAASTSATTTNNAEVYFLERIVSATAAASSGGTISASLQWSGAIATFIAVRNTVAVATGTNPASVGVNPGDTNKTIDGFKMTASAGTPQVTAVQATVTNPGNLSSIKLYLDGGTTVGSYDAGDTLLATVATPGTTVDFTGLTQTPATTGTNYVIAGDIAGGATATQTVTAVVSDITVTAPDAPGAIADTSATLTINLVPVFSFSAANFNKTEGNSGTSSATITVTRSGLTTGAYTVNYATSDGTATVASGDYLAASGTLSFASGETSKTFTVTVNGDVGYETDETVNLTLSSPSVGSYLGSPNPATLTIVNNDPLPSVGFYLPTSTGIVQSGSASIPVRLSSASGSTVTVKYNTANGTAATPANYTGVVNGTLTFNPGEVLKNIPITLTSGNNLTFTVTLSAPTNALLGTPLTNTITMFTKYPSTITSCNGCHGTASAFADGATRNNPANTFPGSHNEHVIIYGYACSACHVTPGGTSYNHRNGAINMAANINGDTGGAYGKGASWIQVNPPAAFQACSNTYCHSQGTSKTSNAGETRTTTMSAPTATLNWGSAGSCDSCHGYPPGYATGDTTWGAAKANSHVKHDAFGCFACHNETTKDGVSVASLARHANRFYNISAIGSGTTATFTYTYAAAGGGCGTIYCHNLAGVSQSATWGGTITLGCIDCHSKTIYRTNGRPGKTLAAVKNEFNLTWGHRNAARTTANGAVSGADCIVCHLEGNYTTQKPSDFHADGNIDLRDPQGSGETPITNLTGGIFTFQRFSTSFAAGSRTTTGHLNNDDIAQVISIKFCLGCHRSGGATNTTARSNNGGTGSAAMPFGGINLGANYTVANGATTAGGLVNAFSQFSSGNSSRHPVLAPNTRDFPTAARLVAPYNNQEAGRINSGGVRTQSVVMTCFDCHNTSGLLTTRTVAAHGNAVSLRGTYYVATPTLCTACHGGSATYATGSSTDHGAGSALANSSNQASMTTCAACHASATSKPARPRPAQDYHGTSTLVSGANWPNTGRVYAFIRNTANLSNHRPLRSTEFTTGSATCTTTGSCQGGTYTTGGTY